MIKIDEIITGMSNTSLPSNYWASPNMELSELEDCRLIFQRNGQSVWEHTMSVIDLLTIKNPITLLSGLFHDLGKANITPLGNVSTHRFPGHADKSARIVEIRLYEWGASSYMIDRVVRLVSTHMFDISNAMREKTIRKFVADVGIDNMDNWFSLRIADSRSYTSQQKYRNHFIEPFRRRIMLYLSEQPISDSPKFECFEHTNRIQIKGAESK